MGVQAAIGGTVAWHSEIDKGACKILAHRYPDTPNLGDITTVDWSRVEPVDVLVGGFPCTDVSTAGKRAGLRPGTRTGLWTQMAYAIEQLRPRMVVAENVRGLLSAEAHSDVEPCPWCLGDGPGVSPLRALGAVLGDLAELGYDSRVCGLGASDVGAPHGRFRVFVVAHADRGGHWHRPGPDGEKGRAWPWGAAGGHHAPAPDAERGGRDGRAPVPVGGPVRRAAPAGGRENTGAPPDADAVRHERDGGDRLRRRESDAGRGAVRHQREGRRTRERPRELAGSRGATTPPDAEHDGPHGAEVGRGVDQGEGIRRVLQPEGPPAGTDWGQYAAAIHRWETILGRPAPPPTTPGRNGPRLSARFVEFLMGLPDGWVTDVPGLTRNEALKALGNGCVPQQVAATLRLLLDRHDTPTTC